MCLIGCARCFQKTRINNELEVEDIDKANVG